MHQLAIMPVRRDRATSVTTFAAHSRVNLPNGFWPP